MVLDLSRTLEVTAPPVCRPSECHVICGRLVMTESVDGTGPIPIRECTERLSPGGRRYISIFPEMGKNLVNAEIEFLASGGL